MRFSLNCGFNGEADQMLQSQAVKRLAHIADHHAAPTAIQHAQNLRANKLL